MRLFTYVTDWILDNISPPLAMAGPANTAAIVSAAGRTGRVLMFRHQTSQRSPRRVVLPYSWIVGCVFFVALATACGTADDFANDSALTETETGPELEEALVIDEPSPPAEPSERPVLEVTPQATMAASNSSVETAQSASDAADGSAVSQTADGVDSGPTTTATQAPTATKATTATTSVAATAQTEPPSQATTPQTPAETTPTTTPPQTQAPTTEPIAAPVTAPPQAATGEANCKVSCNIAMEGDSLTVGLGNRLCLAVKTGNCINSGIVGRRVDEMIVTARTDVDNQVGSGSNDVLILWGGTNDLWQKFHSPDPATNAVGIYENIKTFVAERRAAGWDYIYVMTLPPMNPQYVVGTEPLNDLIRQNGAGADGIIDVGADPRLANAFDPAMRAADGIHFGDGGRAVVMEHIFGAIGELDGV